MTTDSPAQVPPLLTAEWPFPVAAALGSAVRATGIERELRMRLPWSSRPALSVGNGTIRLAFPRGESDAFDIASEIVSDALETIAALPVLPGEAEDILAITPRERLKWTKDGRLKSAGTRTVKMRGRSKSVTFHVFDPRHVEDVLDRDLPTLWREEDAAATAEARRRAAGKAARTRAGKGAESEAAPKRSAAKASPRPRLEGFEAFEAEGLLR